MFSDSQLRSQDRPKSHPKAPEQAPRFGQRWNRRQAKAAAGALFDKLNTDKDNTIDTKELQGRVSKKDLAANDPDKDNALTKEKYLALVAARFKVADPRQRRQARRQGARNAGGEGSCEVVYV